MYKNVFILIGALAMSMVIAAGALAGPDQYCGDTAIYGGLPTVAEPNVLIFIDNSGSMSDSIPGGIYDPNVDYSDNGTHCFDDRGRRIVCNQYGVYTSSYDFFNASVNNVTTSCRGSNPQNLLLTTGQYNGRRLNTDGSCRSRGTGSYLLGNYINWRYGPGANKQKIAIARDVISELVRSTFGIRFGLMTFHYVGGTGEGSQLMSSTFASTTYVTAVSTMTDTFAGTYTNRDALVSTVQGLTPSGNTPLGESLFEIMRYFKGGATAFSNTIGVDASGNYTTPIEYGCQRNYVIFVTDGESNADNQSVLTTICTNGDCDGDGVEPNNKNHTLDDVAKYLYDNDLIPNTTMDDVQRVRTYTVGFGDLGGSAAAVTLLKRAADANHGHGNYFEAQSESQLSSAFTSVVSAILEENTSFVAPVVPVSPENRTYSGSRVYMGFFKPENGKFWIGNLKKYGIDNTNNLTDSHIPSEHATFVDRDANGFDDRDNAQLRTSETDGSFRPSARSYWSIATDAGNVDAGGVGEILYERTTARNIYTYLGSASALTNSANAFSRSNTAINETTLDVADSTERDKLIDFIYGLDAYDDSIPNGNTTEKRTWVLGDILHSRPQIVSYGSYTVATDESNCSRNKTMIFVGANDGMMHAFKDCDGSEAWAFVPPDLLPVLQYLGPTGTTHTYFVDYSPSVYIYNRNRDGNIDSVNGDRVLLLFGLKRGGGLDSAPTAGYYYALDVTNPLEPVFLWKKSTATAGFTEFGETWSDISIGKIKVGSQVKIAAFMGAGYDNCHEDARYGPTQTYDTACVSSPTNDAGATTSPGTLTATALATSTTATMAPKGRGLYIVELATLNSSDIPELSNSGAKIWSYTYADDPSNMLFSMASRVKPIDKNYDNFIDTLYAGDMGGNLWRFSIMDASTTAWTANRIFSTNPGYENGTLNAASTGRKIFFEPSGFVQEDGTIRLYFGTGDREHPLNKSVVDRMYGLIDRGQTTTSAINESRLVDVTDNTLQDPNATQTEISTLVTQLTSTTKYGWYIRLNESGHEGEKVLSPALSFNQMVIYTTYSPVAQTTTDPCVTGNLGTSRAYVVDYRFGTAVVNYDTSNDANAAVANLWVRSTGSDFNLMRSDRVKTLGGGIPSGAVMVISQTGQTTVMIGVGGRITTLATTGGGATMPLYWRQNIEYQ